MKKVVNVPLLQCSLRSCEPREKTLEMRQCSVFVVLILNFHCTFAEHRLIVPKDVSSQLQKTNGKKSIQAAISVIRNTSDDGQKKKHNKPSVSSAPISTSSTVDTQVNKSSKSVSSAPIGSTSSTDDNQVNKAVEQSVE